MKVILLQDVPKIGKKFDVKDVSNGYALNFLLPRKQAKMATVKAIQEIEAEKKKYLETQKIVDEKLLETINKLKDLKIEIKANTNEEGKLFAGIGAKEIAEAISEQSGGIIDSKIIELENPIKEIGEHTIKIIVGNEKIELTMSVKAEEK